MLKISLILASNMKGLRKVLGWNQEILAEKAGLSIATIQSLETGRSWLGLDTVTALAKAFDVSDADLFQSGEHVRVPTPEEALEVLEAFVERARAEKP